MIDALIALLPHGLVQWIGFGATLAAIIAAWSWPRLAIELRILITVAAVTAFIVTNLFALWQGARDDLEDEKSARVVVQAKLDAATARERSLQREALRELVENKNITASHNELKDAINDAAKQSNPMALPDAASRAVTCARLRRSGQTGSDAYRDFCER